MEGCCGGDGGAEGLAEEGGAGGGVVESVQGEGDDRDAVGDEAGFSGKMWCVGSCGEAEAAVVAYERVRARDATHGPVYRGAPAEGEVACVL